MKFFVLFCAVVLLFFSLLKISYSSEYYKVIEKTVNNYTTEETYQSTTYQIGSSEGAIALSNGLSGFDCTFTTERWQVGGAIGFYGDTQRPVIGGCKKFNKVLFKFTGGKDNKKWGGNVSIMFPLN